MTDSLIPGHLEALAAVRAIRGGTGGPQPLADAVPARWRQVRGVGRLLLDPALRFGDVVHPDTLAELRAHLAPLAEALGYRDVDLSAMTSGDRRLTQRVARYVHGRTDAGGSPAFAGVRYVSRHGAAWECWALFIGSEHDASGRLPCPGDIWSRGICSLLSLAHIRAYAPIRRVGYAWLL